MDQKNNTLDDTKMLCTEPTDKELQKLLEKAMKHHAKALKEMPDILPINDIPNFWEEEGLNFGFIKPKHATIDFKIDDCWDYKIDNLTIRIEELEQKVRQLSNFNEELIKGIKDMLTYYVRCGRIDISPLIKLGE